MIVRPARADELEYLQGRINDSDQEKVALNTTILHVAEQDGNIVGILPLRLIWQAEPLWIFPEVQNKSIRRRAALLLAKAMESFVGDRNKNRTGIYSYFFVTKSDAWSRLCEKFGCFRIYRGCRTYARDL